MTDNKKSGTFVDFVVNVARVTKVTKGGKTFSFAALIVTGDQQGNVGLGLGKGREVSLAIAKGTAKARKSLIKLAMRGTTVPYDVVGKHGASRVIIRPAYRGTGVIAGGPVRKIMEAAGIQDVLTKSLGSSNPTNVVKATLNAFAQLRTAADVARLRGKTVEELVRSKNG